MLLNNIKFILITLFIVMTTIYESSAVVITPPQRQDLVNVSVDGNVQYDSATSLYTYTYSITSLATSQQDIETFAIDIEGDISNIQSPEGWLGLESSVEPILIWGAIGFGPEGTEIPSHNNVDPSPFQIKPGETLGGFSFQSSEPALTTKYYAQGFAPLPEADDPADFIDEGIEDPLFTENSKIGFTVGPGLDDNLIFAGGRRPSVDGFLGFVGSANRETRIKPVTIIIRFANNGETVDTSTFTATLNRVDVKASFQPTGNGDELLGIFDIGSSPLAIGRNVLNTSVEGIVPGTTRTATDGDSFTFFVD